MTSISKDLNPSGTPQIWGVDIGTWTTSDLTDYCKKFKCTDCVAPCIRSNHPTKQCIAGYWDLGKNENKYDISNVLQTCLKDGASNPGIQERLSPVPLPQLSSEIGSPANDDSMGTGMKILILTFSAIVTSILENIAYANIPFYRHKFKKLKKKLVGRREKRKERKRQKRQQVEDSAAENLAKRLKNIIMAPAASSLDYSETDESVSRVSSISYYPFVSNIGAGRPNELRGVRPYSHRRRERRPNSSNSSNGLL